MPSPPLMDMYLQICAKDVPFANICKLATKTWILHVVVNGWMGSVTWVLNPIPYECLCLIFFHMKLNIRCLFRLYCYKVWFWWYIKEYILLSLLEMVVCIIDHLVSCHILVTTKTEMLHYYLIIALMKRVMGHW